MKATLAVFIFFYLTALHSSIAGMEIFAWATTAMAFGYAFYKRDFSIFKRNRGTALWLLAMVVATFVSLIATPLEKPFWFQFGFMRWTIVLWGLALALQMVWDENFERRFKYLWMFLMAITGAYAAVQCLTGIDLIREGVVYPQGGGLFKAVGWFSFSMTFAYIMGMSTFAISGPALQGRYRMLGILALTMGAAGILAAMSRGAWLASLACVYVYLGFNYRRWIVPVTAFVALLISGLVMFNPVFHQKIMDMVHMNIDHSSSVRIDIWRGYWQLFLDQPLFGVGMFEGDKLLPEVYQRLGIQQEFVSHAHNNFLQWLAGSGIFGFVTYTGIVCIYLRKAWRLRLVTSWGWSLLLAQLFLHFGGMTEANFIDGEVNHFLVFIWALTLSLEHKTKLRT